MLATTQVPTDLVIFRHAGRDVFTKPGADYDEALSLARQLFPQQLGGVPRDRIGFSIPYSTQGGLPYLQGKHNAVWISETAWNPVVSRLKRSEIIDVNITPAPNALAPPSVECPPEYLDIHQPGRIRSSSPHSSVSSIDSKSSKTSLKPGSMPPRSTTKTEKKWFKFKSLT